MAKDRLSAATLLVPTHSALLRQNYDEPRARRARTQRTSSTAIQTKAIAAATGSVAIMSQPIMPMA